MTVPSGADVTLGTDDFFIEESLPEHYIHALADAQTFFSVQEAGPRVQHATLFHNNRYWYMSDWTQGEGSQSWGNQVDNDAYDQGFCNTRIPGRFTTRPIRQDVTAPFAGKIADADSRLQMFQAGGLLWCASGASTLFFTANGTAWNSVGITGLSANQQIRALAGDGPFLYVAVTDAVKSAGKVKILRFDAAQTQTDVLNDTSVGNPDFAAFVHHDGHLYAWNGSKLRQYDITDPSAFPMTNSPVNVVFANTDEDPVTWPLYADAVATDNSFVFMSAYLGDTRVYQGKDAAYSQIWKMPDGFTGHGLGFNGGLLFIAGEYENRAALFTMSMQTLQSTFVGYVRPWKAGALVSCAAGPGAQVLLMHSTEGAFIYDYIQDAISNLDYNSSLKQNISMPLSNPGSMITFAGNRYAMYALGTGSSFSITKWQHDLTQAAGTTATDTVLYSPEWDFGFVNATKVMLGLHLETLPLASGDSVVIQYLLEEKNVYNTFPSSPSDFPVTLTSPVWTTLGSATFAQDGPISSKYFDLTSTGNSFGFRHMRLRVQLMGKPTVTLVAPRVEMGPGQETWTVLLRLRDELPEQPGLPSQRASNRQATAETLRAKLWGYARARVPIRFLDGYPYRQQENKFDSYMVVIEEPNDDIDQNSQGEMKLTLRRVDGNSMA